MKKVLHTRSTIYATLRSLKDRVFAGACAVECTADNDEIVSLEFPQLNRETDGQGVSVYMCLDGADLIVNLCDRDGLQLSFRWCETTDKWVKTDRG